MEHAKLSTPRCPFLRDFPSLIYPRCGEIVVKDKCGNNWGGRAPRKVEGGGSVILSRGSATNGGDTPTTEWVGGPITRGFKRMGHGEGDQPKGLGGCDWRRQPCGSRSSSWTGKTPWRTTRVLGMSAGGWIKDSQPFICK